MPFPWRFPMMPMSFTPFSTSGFVKRSPILACSESATRRGYVHAHFISHTHAQAAFRSQLQRLQSIYCYALINKSRCFVDVAAKNAIDQEASAVFDGQRQFVERGKKRQYFRLALLAGVLGGNHFNQRHSVYWMEEVNAEAIVLCTHLFDKSIDR